MFDISDDQWDGPDDGSWPDINFGTAVNTTLISEVPVILLTDRPMGELVTDEITTRREALVALNGVQRRIAAEQAMENHLLNRVAALHDATTREFAADAVAAELAWSPREARKRMELAAELTSRLPATLAALETGAIDLPKARSIQQATQRITDPATIRNIEDRVLPVGRRTLRQVQQRVRRAVLELDPAGAGERHQRALTERRVELVSQDDGMAGLWALLPAEQAVAIHRQLTALANTNDREDPRTVDQRRADVFADLLLGAQNDRPKVQVNLTVPAGTALGGSAPAELDGYGPISADVARELLSDATWRRILTDPASGAVLDVGRTRYRPPADLARHVVARDLTCVFPGCSHPARSADLDHTKAWNDGGDTSPGNLGVLCRHHHRLKHETSWSLEQPTPGAFRWTSPDGRRYRTGCDTDPPDTASNEIT